MCPVAAIYCGTSGYACAIKAANDQSTEDDADDQPTEEDNDGKCSWVKFHYESQIDQT